MILYLSCHNEVLHMNIWTGLVLRKIFLSLVKLIVWVSKAGGLIKGGGEHLEVSMV